MKSRIAVATLATVALLAGVAASASAQNRELTWTKGVPTECGPGITISVAELMTRERLGLYPHMKDFKRDHRDNVLISPDKDKWPDRSGLPQNPLAPAISQWPPRSLASSGGVRGNTMPYVLGLEFNGSTIGDGTAIPPDTMGGVSPTQIMVVTNNWIRIFNKSGVVGGLNMNVDNFFASVHGGTGISDPKCTFDPISGRWFIVGINLTTPNRCLIAVSSGATITNASSFTFFQFQQDLVGTTPNANTGQFLDYPTLGVDANAVYVGGSMFILPSTYTGNTLFVIRKSALLANSLVVTPARSIGAGGSGVFVGHGCDNWDAASTTGYFLGVDAGVFSRLVMHRISTPGGTPSFSSAINLTVPTTVYPQNQPALGSTQPLHALDDRLFAVKLFYDKNNNRRTIWAAHNIEVNSSGVGSTVGNRNGSRWYEIQNIDAAPTLRQSGTVFDPAASNPAGYWIPSVGMSMQGHALIGTSAAGAALRASVGYSSRMVNDALGAFAAPALAETSSTSYNVQTGSVQRWGDYSNTVLDPANGMTMWTFQEYCNANNSYAVRVVQFLAPAPATGAVLSPNSAAQGSTLNVTVTGTSSGGTGYFEPGATFSNHIAAAFSGSGITVNSITYTNPTHLTLNITINGAAATGLRNLTITNPDAQATTTNNVFTVNSSVANVNPGSFSIVQGLLFGGSLSSLFTSDNLYVTILNDELSSNGEIEAIGTSPLGTTSAVSFTFETAASRNDLSEFVRLFNYNTSAWEQVNFRTTPITDGSVTINVTSSASRFVQAGTGQMKARILWIPQLDFEAGDGWTERIDRMTWVVTP